jgi:hypothetical protein
MSDDAIVILVWLSRGYQCLTILLLSGCRLSVSDDTTLFRLSAISVWRYYSFQAVGYQCLTILLLSGCRLSVSDDTTPFRLSAVSVWRYYSFQVVSYQCLTILLLSGCQLSVSDDTTLFRLSAISVWRYYSFRLSAISVWRYYSFQAVSYQYLTILLLSGCQLSVSDDTTPFRLSAISVWRYYSFQAVGYQCLTILLLSGCQLSVSDDTTPFRLSSGCHQGGVSGRELHTRAIHFSTISPINIAMETQLKGKYSLWCIPVSWALLFSKLLSLLWKQANNVYSCTVCMKNDWFSQPVVFFQ